MPLSRYGPTLLRFVTPLENIPFYALSGSELASCVSCLHVFRVFFLLEMLSLHMVFLPHLPLNFSFSFCFFVFSFGFIFAGDALVHIPAYRREENNNGVTRRSNYGFVFSHFRRTSFFNSRFGIRSGVWLVQGVILGQGISQVNLQRFGLRKIARCNALADIPVRRTSGWWWASLSGIRGFGVKFPGYGPVDGDLSHVYTELTKRFQLPYS